MGVEREEISAPDALGSAIVTRIYRAAAGGWSAELDLNFAIEVGDGRQVFVRRIVKVRANEQRGRKRAQSRGTATSESPE